MKKNTFILFISICLITSLCSCTIKSHRKISEKVLTDRKAAYENYLKETYPDETFTVKVWQEYGKDIVVILICNDIEAAKTTADKILK